MRLIRGNDELNMGASVCFFVHAVAVPEWSAVLNESFSACVTELNDSSLSVNIIKSNLINGL